MEKNLIDNGVEEKIPERTTPASFLQCRYFLFYFFLHIRARNESNLAMVDRYIHKTDIVYKYI